MGGFTLKGPTHTIVSTAPINCRCLGYQCSIEQDLQDYLIHKRPHILDLDDLPQSLKDDMNECHLPDDMSYEIRTNPIPIVYAKPKYNPNAW